MNRRDAAADPVGGHRLVGLDGIRGVAIIAVMVYHFVLIAGPPPATRLDVAIRGVAGLGWAGVDLFFVLSGFLITGILYDSKARARHYFRAFYARRILRIVPLYYLFLVLLLVAVSLVASPSSADFQELRRSQVWLWTYSTNIWIATRGGSNIDLYGTGHLWSLAIEEQFYLLWPLVVFAFNRRVLMRVCIAGMAAAWVSRIVLGGAGVDPFVTYTSTLTRLDTLAAGAFLALAMRDASQRAAIARWARPAAIVSCLVIALVAIIHRDLNHLETFVQALAFTPIAVLAAAIVSLELTSPAGGLVHRCVQQGWLRACGRYSYAMYIFHWPIATWLAWNFDIAGAVPRAGDSDLPGRILFCAAAAGLTWCAAQVSWHVCEKHFLQLKGRFRYEAPSVPATSAQRATAA